jgi:hypothetical protein
MKISKHFLPTILLVPLTGLASCVSNNPPNEVFQPSNSCNHNQTSACVQLPQGLPIKDKPIVQGKYDSSSGNRTIEGIIGSATYDPTSPCGQTDPYKITGYAEIRQSNNSKSPQTYTASWYINNQLYGTQVFASNRVPTTITSIVCVSKEALDKPVRFLVSPNVVNS